MGTGGPGLPEARLPQRGEPPARGQAGLHRWWATSGRGRGTGRGPAGRRGYGRCRRGCPHGRQGGQEVGGRPWPRQRAWDPARPGPAPSACGQAPARARAGWGTPPQGPSRTDTAPARAVACRRRGAAGRRRPGRSGGPSHGPLEIPGPPAPSAGTAGAMTAGRASAGIEARRATGRVPRGAEEQEATPEHAEAGAPEPPDAIIPAAPVVQAGHEIVEERAGRMSRARLQQGGTGRAPRSCTVSPVCHALLRGWCAADTGVSSSPALYVGPCWVVLSIFLVFLLPLHPRMVRHRSRPVPGQTLASWAPWWVCWRARLPWSGAFPGVADQERRPSPRRTAVRAVRRAGPHAGSRSS